MKQLNLLIAIFILTTFARAQDKKLSVGVAGSLDFYDYQFIKEAGFNHTYSTKTTYSTGINVLYTIKNKFGLKTGLLYSDKGYTIDYKWTAVTPNDPAIPEKSNVKTTYLDVPVMLTYNITGKRKVSVFTSAGAITCFAIGCKESTVMANGLKKETNILKKHTPTPILMAVELNLGLRLHLSEKIFLTLAPFYRYGFNSTDTHSIQSNPTSYGACSGIFYNLR